MPEIKTPDRTRALKTAVIAWESRKRGENGYTTTSPEYCQSQIDFFKKQLITKEEYLTKSTELRKRKLEIETELRELEENYINSNLEYLMGDKLEIFRDGVTTGTFGFVRDMSTHNGDIIPRLYKCKKDGTPSKHEYYLWGRGLTFIRVK